MKKYLFSGVAIAAVISGIWWKSAHPPKPNPLDSFARCLAARGVTMYGADSCSHCQNEKKAFGSAFQYAAYVECRRDPKRCLEMNIQSYPTWIFSGGQRVEGEQGLAGLSAASGCALP